MFLFQVRLRSTLQLVSHMLRISHWLPEGDSQWVHLSITAYGFSAYREVDLFPWKHLVLPEILSSPSPFEYRPAARDQSEGRAEYWGLCIIGIFLVFLARFQRPSLAGQMRGNC